jgi:hypothetical protein
MLYQLSHVRVWRPLYREGRPAVKLGEGDPAAVKADRSRQREHPGASSPSQPGARVRYARLPVVAVYEVTFTYPTVPYEENGHFPASVIAARSSPLQGFRRRGDGVALTFVVTTDCGIESALAVATQRAAGMSPDFGPRQDDGHFRTCRLRAWLRG